MNEFELEISAWEAYLNSCPCGSTVSSFSLLALIADEDDESAEEAFTIISDRDLTLDITDIPLPVFSTVQGERMLLETDFIKNGAHTEDLEDSDPLKIQLQEIAEADPDMVKDPIERSVILGLKKAVLIAFEYAGKGVMLSDLIQEASMAVWQLTLQKDLCFEKTIRNALSKAVLVQAKSDGTGRKISGSLQTYKDTDRALLVELGRNPELEEIAERMHISTEAASLIRKMIMDADMVQQAQKLLEKNENTEPEAELPPEDTAYYQLRERIEDMLSALSEQDARILSMRFGLNRSRALSVAETAQALHMTSEQISCREKEALAMLRNAGQSE